MKSLVSVDDFEKEVDCFYKEERFKVRDNGCIYRYARAGKRVRQNDGQWTFGNPNNHTGYMDINTLTVHRIVATAFHGVPPTPKHVVDHIDTNKRNNRPENLRWVTRLENILLNPITARRIASICGSVEAFLAEPSKYKDDFPDPNFSWMCTVSAQEAKISLDRMLSWAKDDMEFPGRTLSEWVTDRGLPKHEPEYIQEPPSIIKSKTLNAAQRDWRIPSEFLCCPLEISDEPLQSYAANLITGSIFCRNDLYEATVERSALSKDGQALYVITEEEDGIKRYGLAEITYEDGLFIHTNRHKFFSKEGVEKQFTLAQGLEWTGGDSIDDYC